MLLHIGWLTPGYALNQRSDSVWQSNQNGWQVLRASRDGSPVPKAHSAAMSAGPAKHRLPCASPSNNLLRLSLLLATKAGEASKRAAASKP